jgi:biopolymer transport protein ExbB
MPDPDRRTPARLLALTLAFGLLGAACGLAHAQTAAERSSASAASSAPVAIAAPALTPSRDLPLIRPPSTESPAAPYGLQAVWEQGDPVARATLLILLIMSMASWYVLVHKLIEQARMRRLARSATASLTDAKSLREAANLLQPGSPFRFIAEAGLEATRKHEGLLGQINLNDWMSMSIQRSIDRVQSRMQDGLAFLATVGSISPFVGLFGTVWGILNALTAIGVAGQASIDKVAGPVGEALIMTAIGLAVAVPAVMGYNWLVRRNKAVMDDVRSFGGDLHAVLLAAGNSGAGATAAKG